MRTVSSNGTDHEKYTEARLISVAGEFCLDELSLLKVTGEDAARFLQGQLTCDITQITQFRSLFGACCTPGGRMVSLFRIFKLNGDFIFIMDSAVVEAFQHHLNKYIPFFKAEIKDISADYSLTGLSHSITELNPEQIIEVDQHRQLQLGSSMISIIGFSPQRWIVIALTHATDHLQHLFKSRTIHSSQQDWNYLNILQKIPTLGQTSIEQFVPHEVGLPELGGVSFNKGCYTGQEIIARMEYRGRLNKHPQILAPLRPEKQPGLNTFKPADTLQAIEKDNIISIGKLINLQQNTASETLLLASLKDSWAEKGKFTLNSEIPTILKVRP